MVPRAVLLNRQDRSPALQLSADQLEVGQVLLTSIFHIV